MRIQCELFNPYQRLVIHEPLVVLGDSKKRDAPVIYHRRDTPLFVIRFVGGDGPCEGTGPPYGPGLPDETGPPDTG